MIEPDYHDPFVNLQMSLSDRLGQGRLNLRPTQTRVTTAGIYLAPVDVRREKRKQYQ
jgi:hypothetical protein